MLSSVKLILVFLLVSSIFSCTTNQKKQIIQPVSNKNELSEMTFAFTEKLLNSYLQSQYKNEVQQFTISSQKTNWVIAKNGFKIFVDPQKLCTKAGTEITNENLTINITEILNLDQMIAANAPTVSNGKILQSGGSYFVEVKQNNEILQLKKNSSLSIQIPNVKSNGMQLFIGNKNEQGFVNWEPTQTEFISKPYFQYINNFYTIKDYNKIKDSIGERPATLAECIKIYNDSTMKARWAYTIANRHILSHKQEMAYGLRPINFPYKRYYENVVEVKEKYFGCYGYHSLPSLSSLSSMYFVKDTFPVYKEIIRKQVDFNNIKNKLDYYEPVETYSLGWINVDKFYNEPTCDSTMFVFNNTKLSKCKIYYKFTELNSLLAENIEFTKPTPNLNCIAATRLPKNKNVEIIVIGIQNGVIVQGRKKIITNKSNLISMQLQPI